jgi:hypothetical protein
MDNVQNYDTYNNNKICLADKAGFEKTGISHFGPSLFS